jgi:hypothetical protein
MAVAVLVEYQEVVEAVVKAVVAVGEQVLLPP